MVSIYSSFPMLTKVSIKYSVIYVLKHLGMLLKNSDTENPHNVKTPCLQNILQTQIWETS